MLDNINSTYEHINQCLTQSKSEDERPREVYGLVSLTNMPVEALRD